MNKKELECLRDLTSLGPISTIRVLKARHNNQGAEEEFTKADRLEYSLRMCALITKLEDIWQDYIYTEHDGYSRAEFAQMYLLGYEKKQEENSSKQKVKKLS